MSRMHGCSLRMRESRQVLALRKRYAYTGFTFVHDKSKKSERRESRTFRAYLRVSLSDTIAAFHSREARAQLEYWS
jgi:hypothetical protein